MNSKRKKWTTEEEAILIEIYFNTNKQDLVKKFNTSYQAIKLKAHKLGLNKRKLDIDFEKLKEDYAKFSLEEIQKKYSLSLTTLYRLLKSNSVSPNRKLTDFGDNLAFKENYQKLTKNELERLYNTSYTNIKLKASNLKISKPANLISRPTPKLTEEELYTDYIILNLTSDEIAKKHNITRSWVSCLLRRYKIIKDKKIILQQTYNTNIKKYGTAHPSNCYGKTETEIKDWLNSLGYNFKPNYELLEGKEIDMYDANLKFGIEYCGLYWHNENSPQPRDSKYHYNKMKRASEKGVRLVTIFEDEWLHRQAQVKNFLKSVLHKNTRNIYARKCVILEVSKKDACDFIDAYHIQGASSLGKYFAGLYYKDELVGIMSFGRHHRDTTQLVLDRLCFKDDCNVVGGSSKLFKFLLNLSNSNNIISWSDNRISIGSVYEALGFKLEEELGPDYSYVDTKNNLTKRKSKQSQKKKTVNCPVHLTEKQWCIERGLFRIWDCGKKRWRYIETT